MLLLLFPLFVAQATGLNRLVLTQQARVVASASSGEAQPDAAPIPPAVAPAAVLPSAAEVAPAGPDDLLSGVARTTGIVYNKIEEVTSLLEKALAGQKTCSDVVCGGNAKCWMEEGKGASCTCNQGYEGDPYKACGAPVTYNILSPLLMDGPLGKSPRFARGEFALTRGTFNKTQSVVLASFRQIGYNTEKEEENVSKVMLGVIPEHSTQPVVWMLPQRISKEEARNPYFVALNSASQNNHVRKVGGVYRDKDGNCVAKGGVVKGPTGVSLRLSAPLTFCSPGAGKIVAVPVGADKFAAFFEVQKSESKFGSAVVFQVDDAGKVKQIGGDAAVVHWWTGAISNLSVAQLTENKFALQFEATPQPGDGGMVHHELTLAPGEFDRAMSALSFSQAKQVPMEPFGMSIDGRGAEFIDPSGSMMAAYASRDSFFVALLDSQFNIVKKSPMEKILNPVAGAKGRSFVATAVSDLGDQAAVVVTRPGASIVADTCSMTNDGLHCARVPLIEDGAAIESVQTVGLGGGKILGMFQATDGTVEVMMFGV